MGGTESCARDPMALTSPQVANVVPTMRLPGKVITFRIPLAQSVPIDHHRPGREFDALGCQHARCLHTADTVPSASTARSVCAMQPNLKPLLEVPRYARVALRRLVRDGSGCIRPPRTAFDCPAQRSTAPHSVRSLCTWIRQLYWLSCLVFTSGTASLFLSRLIHSRV